MLPLDMAPHFKPGTIIEWLLFSTGEYLADTTQYVFHLHMRGMRYTHHVIGSHLSSTKKHDAKVKTQIFHLLFQRPSTQGDGVY